MTPSAIIRDAAADGVSLALTPAGTIKAAGDAGSVARWIPVIREHKPGIVEALQEAANDTANHPDTPESYVDRRELAHIVATFHKAAGDTDAVIGECVRDAMLRPELALRCYRALREQQLKRTIH